MSKKLSLFFLCNVILSDKVLYSRERKASRQSRSVINRVTTRRTLRTDWQDSPEAELEFWQAKERYHVPTWSPQYIEVTKKIRELQAEKIKNNDKSSFVGVEIGVAFGTQSLDVLQNNPEVKWYCVDPYKQYGDPLANDVPHASYWNYLYEYVLSKFTTYIEQGRCTFLRMESWEAYKNFENNSLDLVYIDGDHNYEPVNKDLRLWFDKVKPGGYIVGDDYGREFHDVTKAVDDFVAEKNLPFERLGIYLHKFCIKKLK